MEFIPVIDPPIEDRDSTRCARLLSDSSAPGTDRCIPRRMDLLTGRIAVLERAAHAPHLSAPASRSIQGQCPENPVHVHSGCRPP